MKVLLLIMVSQLVEVSGKETRTDLFFSYWPGVEILA